MKRFRPARIGAPCLVALLSMTAGACAGGVGGEVHVSDLPVIAVEEGLRLGDLEDPTIGFSQIGGADVDRDGNIYVLEGSVPEIRAYESSGQLLRRIGRRGGGPGEFEMAPRFGVVGDTLWTIDPLRGRITLFDRSGQVLSTGTAEGVTISLPESLGRVLPRALRPDGRFTSHLGLITYSRDSAPTGVQPTDRIPVPWVLFDPNGTVVDTIGWTDKPPPRMWRPPSEESPAPEYVTVDGRRSLVPSPPTTLPWWEAVLEGYIVVEVPQPETEMGEFTVTRIDLSGDTVFSRILRYDAQRYTEAELDSVAARAARGAAGGMLSMAPMGGGSSGPPENWEEIARALRGAMNFPTYQSPVQYAWVGQDESIWLRWSGEVQADARWVIIEADGEAGGQVVLPRGAQPVWRVGDEALVVVRDDLEVPWLVKYRLRSD